MTLLAHVQIKLTVQLCLSLARVRFWTTSAWNVFKKPLIGLMLAGSPPSRRRRIFWVTLFFFFQSKSMNVPQL